jgi:hypothetical protein
MYFTNFNLGRNKLTYRALCIAPSVVAVVVRLIYCIGYGKTDGRVAPKRPQVGQPVDKYSEVYKFLKSCY